MYPERTKEDIVTELQSLEKELFFLEGNGTRDKKICGSLTNEDILYKDWETLTSDDFDYLSCCGFRHREHIKKEMIHEETYQVCMLADYCRDEMDLKDRISRLFRDKACGSVLRVKGYVQDLSGNWYLVNATRNDIQVERADIRRSILIVIGQELNDPAIHEVFIKRLV